MSSAESEGSERKLVDRETTIPPIQAATKYKPWYQEHFADILNTARLLRAYLSGKPDYSQPTVFSSAIKLACRILSVDVRHAANGRNYWRLRKNSDSSLRAAGLDTETLEIVDLDRARACWMQLIETRLFRPERQQEFLERVRRGETPIRDKGYKTNRSAPKTTWHKKKFSSEESPENNPFNMAMLNAAERRKRHTS